MPLGDLAGLVAALVLAGLVVGFLVGLLGIGGGAILVPVLFEVFTALGVEEAIRLHLSIGTSLAAMVPTTLRSFAAHHRSGAVDTQIVRSMVVPVVLGVVLGSLIARVAAQDVLAMIWAVCAALLSLRLILSKEHWRLGDKVPGNPFRALYGVFVGLFSSLMSIGGAVFIVAMMTLYGRSIHQAVATSSGFGPMIAIPGTIGFIWAGWGAHGLPPASLGYVSLIGAAVILPTSLTFAPIGARLAHRFPRRALELAVAGLLAAIALRFVLTLV